MGGRQWSGSTFGNGWMHSHLIRILRFIDARFIYVFAYIFIIPVCLLVCPNLRTSFSFYRDRFHFSVFRSLIYTYLNNCRFAQVVIDRFAMYAGKRFDVEIIGDDFYKALTKRKEGFLQLSSHIGNYEIAGYSLNSENKTINAVVYSHEKKSVMESRNSMFVKTNVNMIELREDMSHLMEIDNAICNGDIVSFPSDRHISGAKCLTADFFGSPACFPQGPFSVATMRGLEVIAVNVMKTGSRKYRIILTPLSYDKTQSRKLQTQQLCESYVRELEKTVREYPCQWYNFFDFWAK